MMLALFFLTLCAHAEEEAPRPLELFGITLGQSQKVDDHVLTGAEIGQSFRARLSELKAEQDQSEDSAFSGSVTSAPFFQTERAAEERPFQPAR